MKKEYVIIIVAIALALIIGYRLGTSHIQPTIIRVGGNQIEEIEIIETIETNFIDYTKAIEEIKENAKNEWKDNYRMVEFEIDRQVESLDEIISNIDSMGRDILDRAMEEWGNNFRMVLFEYDRQLESKKRL